MQETKSYKNGDKITFWEDQENEKGASIVLTYYRPHFQDAHLLYSLYQKFAIDYSKKNNMSLENDQKLQDIMACVVNMKADEHAVKVWSNCLKNCLIGTNLFPLAITLEENEPFYDRILMFMLETCYSRFNSFTKPHNG